MRAYHLRRDQDVSGKSGTGRVAQVAVFDDGTAVVHWSGDKTKAAVASTEVFSSIEDMMRVHGHEGRTRGKVVVEGRRFDDATVELTVRDDGHGIAEDNLRRVFDPFFTTKLGRGGTGLGLPICHNLVTQTLGGDIRIESSPGAGTAVIIKLPVHAPASASADAGALHRHAA